MIIWKGYGWCVLFILLAAAVLLLPFEAFFGALGFNAELFQAAAIAALTAIATLITAAILEHRDRKADKDMDAKTAQDLHSFYLVSLTNWGYVACLAAAGLFVMAIWPESGV